jgi:hypothetical protein
MAITIHAERYDAGPNADMIVLKDKAGIAYGLVHVDLFWSKEEDNKDIYKMLSTVDGGADLTISMVEEEEEENA